MIIDQLFSQFGSSPLTRGAPGRVEVTNWGDGLIPAHAGSTVQSIPEAVNVGAHPRSRGEHAYLGW